MIIKNTNQHSLWPELNYEEMESTLYLLHRAAQVIGKLKLSQPFDPHWGNTALWLTSTGLTSGLIHYKNENFSVEIDLLEHQIQVITSWGMKEKVNLRSGTVAELTNNMLQMLNGMGINLKINTMPAEVPNPIRFELDRETRIYHPQLAKHWWQAMCQIHRVLQKYHALFRGISPPVGLMWGTLDLRDVRYKGVGANTKDLDFIRKNAMDDVQIECGWWCGNALYPKPAFFSFTYPQPPQIENAKIEPQGARWESSLSEFLLDYDDIQSSKTPDEDLLSFFNTTYRAGAERGGWDSSLIVNGSPQK